MYTCIKLNFVKPTLFSLELIIMHWLTWLLLMLNRQIILLKRPLTHY